MEELKRILKDYEIIKAFDIGESYVALISEKPYKPDERLYDSYVEVIKNSEEVYGFGILIDSRAKLLTKDNLIYER